MKKRYRSRIRIIMDILDVIDNLEYTEGTALPTKIMYLSNLSYERLNQYLDELIMRKLIEKSGKGFKLTEEGRRFRSELHRIEKFLDAFGLEL